MNKHGWASVIGVVMVVGGLIMFFAFQNLDTAVVGLRQAGLVIAVLGVIEIAVTIWSSTKSRRPRRR